MTHEFTPTPPQIHTETRDKVPVVHLERFMKKLKDAQGAYEAARNTAERADEEAGTEIPFGLHAMIAAEITSTVAIRGADVS
jgi:hypothetical protein